MDLLTELAILVLAAFVGFEVISKVPNTLHTPLMSGTNAISATAPPPTPLNSATICGIAVIFTLRALGMPIAVPITRPTTIRPQSPIRWSISVATTAIAIPTAAT